MTMKLRLMISAAVASTALFATDVESYTYGVLAVSNNSSSNTVVGVPWRNVTEDAVMADITLSNLVSTVTLANDDIVYLYESGTWYGYKLTNGIFVPMTTSSNEQTITPDAANVKTLSRGTGLIVQRASSSDPIYLCGRYDSSSPSAVTIAVGKTLIANPKTVDVNITAGNVGDQILVPGNGGTMKTYTKKTDGWYETVTDNSFGFPMTSQSPCNNGVPLEAGKGAFYVNNGSSSFELSF